MPAEQSRRSIFAMGIAVTLLGVSGHLPGSISAQDARQREIAVAARKYAFAPALIEVQQDDLVKITLNTSDIAHSFTIDDRCREIRGELVVNAR